MGFRYWLVNLPRWPKRLILLGNDFSLLLIALWLSFSLRYNSLYLPESWQFALVLLGAPLLGVVSFHYFGLYRLVTRYIGRNGIVRVYIAVSVSVLVWTLLVKMSQVPEILPRSVIIMYWVLAIFLIWLSRQVASWILDGDPDATPAREGPGKKVLIYGTGRTAVQLSRALTSNPDYEQIAFICDNPAIWGRKINGIKVYRPGAVKKLVETRGVVEAFIVRPNAPRHERREIIRRLEPFPVIVRTLPALEDIASGKVTISDLRLIDVDDLLGRDPVPPVDDLLWRTIRGRSVLITGAGGSIGSELARQVVALGPERLVLLDASEVALYEIDQAIRELAGKDVKIITILGSILDKKLLHRVIQDNHIATIYHAAAYKHVPLVEANPVVGLTNNVFGTLALAETAGALAVERFVLISTDKAVRPTNVMGASKRLSELILQAFADQPDQTTVFTMVRFGNVLDSSGSVVRKFRRQIENGGPVTVTHPEIIRYFMSIPEAAQLVIQAGAMAKGGDVFVLDMGQPVKILDLARSMIRLTGLEVIEAPGGAGDIAIEFVGLRPGEKLYEELLIGENTTGTRHPRILRNNENYLPLAALREALARLEQALERDSLGEIRQQLETCVEGYTPDEETFAATRPVPVTVQESDKTVIEFPGRI